MHSIKVNLVDETLSAPRRIDEPIGPPDEPVSSNIPLNLRVAQTEIPTLLKDNLKSLELRQSWGEASQDGFYRIKAGQYLSEHCKHF